MKPVIYEVWGQCDRCRDAFSVYLHQKRYHDQFDYTVEPSPHLRVTPAPYPSHTPQSVSAPYQQPTFVIHHTHNACGGRIHLFGKLPTALPIVPSRTPPTQISAS